MGVGGANSLGDLSGEGRGDSLDVVLDRAVVDGHLTALSRIETIAVTLVDAVVDREASPQQDSDLSVLEEDDVVVVESHC